MSGISCVTVLIALSFLKTMEGNAGKADRLEKKIYIGKASKLSYEIVALDERWKTNMRVMFWGMYAPLCLADVWR